jgi:hypothetical protein
MDETIPPEDSESDVDLEIVYPGYFLPTLGLMVFDVTFDDHVVVKRRRYLSGFTYRIMTSTGPHKLEIISRNILSGLKNSVPFFVELPTPGPHRVSLVYDRWGFSRWKAPIVKRVSGHEGRPNKPDASVM